MEKVRADAGEDVPFPGWETLREESLEPEPALLLTVRDAEGRPVRRLEAPARAGIQRLAWDLRLPAPDPVQLQVPEFQPPWVTPPEGPLAPPGRYSVEMVLRTADGLEPLAESREFEVKVLPGAVFTPEDYQAATAFSAETRELLRRAQGAGRELGAIEDRLVHLRAALAATPAAEPSLFTRLDRLAATLHDLELRLSGDPIRRAWQEPAPPSVIDRLGEIAGGHWATRQSPTETQRQSQEVARQELTQVEADLTRLLGEELPAVEAALEAAGAPWTPGRRR
jgi:hypothetical protein